MTYTILNLNTVEFTDEQFYRLCLANPERQFERTADGELIIMPPVGEVSGNREADLIAEVIALRAEIPACYFLRAALRAALRK
jgi:Uma2 family endonuclease